MKDFLASIVALVILLTFIVGALNALNDAGCKAQWKDSGFEYRYSMMGGCQIKNKSGVWIPSDAYREVAP